MANLSFRSFITFFGVFLILANFVFADDLQDAAGLLEQGKYKEALDLCKPFVDDNPGNSDANFVLGKIYFKLGKLNEAKTFINKAIELNRSNQGYRDAYNEMSTFAAKKSEATRYISDGKYDDAKKVLTEMITENPNYVEGYSLLGKVAQRLSDVKGASEYYKKAAELEPEVDEHMNAFNTLVNQALHEGSNMMSRNNFIGALTYFQQAIDIDPEDYRGYYYSALVQYREKNYEDAINSCEKAIALNPEYEKTYLIKGKVFMLMRKYNEAISTFDQAIAVNSKYTDAYSNKGLLLFKMKKWDEAIEAYKKVLSLEPKNQKALANIGAAYMEKKDYANASNFLKKSVAMQPRDYKTWSRLAEAYNELDKAQEAKEAAQSALKAKTNYAPALIELGKAELRMGNKQAAKEAFTLAKRDPQWRQLAEYYLKMAQ